MKLILKYVKPFTAAVFLSLLLLFGQAMCDLSLPNLMSDIVNVGIQTSGVEKGAPEIISDDGVALLSHFMSGSDKENFLSAYTRIAPGDSYNDKHITEKYPLLSEKGGYIRSSKDENVLSKADKAYAVSGYAFLLYMQKLSDKTMTQSAIDENGISSVSAEELYKLNSMFSALPAEAFSPYIEKSSSLDSAVTGQISTAFSTLFYQEMGADINAVQKKYIAKTGLKMLAVALLGALAAVAVSYLAAKISTAVAKNIRRDLFAKVSNFSNAEFDNFSTASLITRTTNDVQQVQMLVLMGLKLMCYAPIMGIGGIIMAVGKSISLSWIIAAAVITMLGVILMLLAIAMPKFKILQTLIDKLNLVSRENLTGLMVIRAFGTQKHEEERFDKANEDLAVTHRFVHRTMTFMMPFMMFIMNAVTLLIVWIGAHAIEQSTLQIGDMMAFIQYAMQIIMSFLMIAMMFIMVPRALVSAVRISEVLKSDSSVKDNENASQLTSVKGDVTFKNVSFRYRNAEQDVLSDISFTAKAGQTTAFIGSTGSGKSTLINLIPRFYDVTGGAIEIDGNDIRSISQKQLRDIIGYVPQKGVLFSGDIQSNIRYGAETASEEDILKAIDVAQAKEFVEAKPEGITALIAQGGTNISGGQKQRLSIARALIKKPPIYIFDDSFSALDFKTDKALRKALKDYTGNSTVLIVAQRVSTIMNAEQIIVLDDGKMVGKGTHKELLKTCEQYREIAESQLSKEELE